MCCFCPETEAKLVGVEVFASWGACESGAILTLRYVLPSTSKSANTFNISPVFEFCLDAAGCGRLPSQIRCSVWPAVGSGRCNGESMNMMCRAQCRCSQDTQNRERFGHAWLANKERGLLVGRWARCWPRKLAERGFYFETIGSRDPQSQLGDNGRAGGTALIMAARSRSRSRCSQPYIPTRRRLELHEVPDRQPEDSWQDYTPLASRHQPATQWIFSQGFSMSSQGSIQAGADTAASASARTSAVTIIGATANASSARFSHRLVNGTVIDLDPSDAHAEGDQGSRGEREKHESFVNGLDLPIGYDSQAQF